MSKPGKVPGWVWVFIGVVTILVFLASAGKLNLGFGDEEELGLQGGDSKDLNVGKKEGELAPIAEEENALENQKEEPTQSENPDSGEVPFTSHIEDESISSSKATPPTKEKEELEQSLQPLKSTARRIKALTNVSFFIVRVLFAGVFVGYNILVMETNSMPYSLNTIAALAPYNTWMFMAIGVVLFVMFKSPSNLKGEIHKIHGKIEAMFSVRNSKVFQKVEQLEAEIEALGKDSNS